MSVTAEPQDVDLREPAGWRRSKNRIMTTLMVAAFVITLIPLGFVLVTVIANEFGEATGLFRSALFGLGVLLFAFTIIINVVARAVVDRNARRKRGT